MQSGISLLRRVESGNWFAKAICLTFFLAFALCGGVAFAQSAEPPPYTLGAGDRVRVTVFGEENLSGEFEIDGSGIIAMPLIGTVPVKGRTLRSVETAITTALADGYLVNPRVSVEVTNYRPFFILGEVNQPGSYPYVNGMTILNAVALAGGFTYRAEADSMTIVRAGDPKKAETPATVETYVLPGDIVRVAERFF